MLQNCTNGTFLLRFSDSELGGVTIAWVAGMFYLKSLFIIYNTGFPVIKKCTSNIVRYKKYFINTLQVTLF